MAETSLIDRLLGRQGKAEPQLQHCFPHLCAPKDGYVFVVSYGLSGDLLIQDLLNAVPGVVVRGENGNILRPLSSAWHHAERDVLASFAAHADGSDQRFEDLTLLGWHLANCFVRDVLALPDKTRMAGFREIRYHGNANSFMQQLDFMTGFFPTARFIFNTRDLKQVARTGWWRDQDPATVAETLGGADALFLRYLQRDPARTLHMDFDAYVSDTAKLAEMFEWLGIKSPDKDHMERLVEKHHAALQPDGAV